VADTNQVLIVDGGDALLVDPGGFETFPAVLAALSERVPIEAVRRIFISRPDPDVASSVPLWLRVCPGGADIVTSQVWQHVVTHLDAGASITPIPDGGLDIPVGDRVSVEAIPAPYLPSPGDFHLYDAGVRALYTGAVGSATMPAEGWNGYVVQDFDRHVELMHDSHVRMMPSDAARDAWISRVASLDVDLLVPGRGMVFKGDNVARFIDWFAGLSLASAVPVALPTGGDRDATDDILAEIEALRTRTDGGLEIENEFEPEPAPAMTAEPDMPGEPETSDIDDMFAELLGTSREEWQAPTGDPEPGAGYRLVTRSDFDGLVCAVLLEQLDMIDDILFVHPNDMQEGRVDVRPTDITTNLPYVPGCYLAFDHHLSEVKRLGRKYENHIINPDAPSAARVVYEYYGGLMGFPKVPVDLMEAIDKGDSAQFDMDEVLYADGWPLLNFIMDSRTGLGRFRGFRIPNYELMMSLIEWCQEYTVEQILELPDVKERVDLYREQEPLFKQQIEHCTTVHGNLAVLDRLDEETVYVGNRFMIYALFPQCNISMHIMWGRDRQNVVYAVGKSIFDRTSKTNVGELMLQYGGGGHGAAGTCQSDPAMAEIVKQALIGKINDDG
jgi:nanoRNase/pAp phosphatase (c-di-AMP/oligoRNAs hydrolase)